MSQERGYIAPDNKLSVVKLIEASPQGIEANQVEFTFMIGWSKSSRLEQLKLKLTSQHRGNFGRAATSLSEHSSKLEYTMTNHLFFESQN